MFISAISCTSLSAPLRQNKIYASKIFNKDNIFDFCVQDRLDIGFGNKILKKYEISPITKNDITEGFKQIYGSKPEHVTRAPGRSVFLGEHVDYQNGSILAFAVNGATFVAVSKRNDTKVNVYSDNKKENFCFDLAKEPDIIGYKKGKYKGFWGSYVEGTIRNVLDLLNLKKDEIKGMNIYLKGNVPEGSGLSSSASLEMSIGKAVLSVYEKTLPEDVLAKAGQSAEKVYAGANCGLLDQLASLGAKKGSAVLVNCTKNNTSSVSVNKLADKFKIIICNSGVKHSLGASAFNDRVEQASYAAAKLKKNLYPEINCLSDIKFEKFEKDKNKIKNILTEAEFKRAKHVTSENKRVIEGINAFSKGNYKKIGDLMYKTHTSLSKDMEVSCKELDELVKLAKEGGAIGAKMSGGGFGGCTINLVPNGKIENFIKAISKYYGNKKPMINIVKISDGASEI